MPFLRFSSLAVHVSLLLLSLHARPATTDQLDRAATDRSDAAGAVNYSPAYFELLERAFRNVIPQDKNDDASVEELQAFAWEFLRLSPATMRDEVLRSVQQLGSSESEVLLQGFGVEDDKQNITQLDLCINHVAATVIGWTNRTRWSTQMLDAMGKPPPAVSLGAVKWPGGYEQCKGVRAYTNVTFLSQFSGQYCTANVGLKSKTLPVNKISIGVCIPDSCSGKNMSRIIKDILARRGRPESVNVVCQPENGPLNTRAIVAIVICSVFLVCMVLGTVLDLVYIQLPKKREQTFRTSHITTNANSVEIDESSPLTGKKTAAKRNVGEVGLCVKLLVTFSVYTNASKLLSTSQPAGSLTCVHGIRFLSMTWVVLGHSFIFPDGISGNQLEYILKVVPRWSFQALSSAPFSVDSFFLLSGLLVAYLSLKEMQKKSGKINWFLFYFHRFWRLTPAYMLVIMVVTCLVPYLGKGPFWPVPQNNGASIACEDNWWTNLLYVNNLVHADKMCLGQSWYLANDMQFYILSPLIFVPFYFSPLLGCLSSGLFLLGTAIAPGVLESKNYFPPSAFAQIEGSHKVTENYSSYFYVKPWTRMGPYIVGLAAGYILYKTDCKIRINKFLNLFIWSVVAAAALALVYGLFEAGNGHPVSIGEASVYMAVSRQVWGACLAWVVIACCTGNGGFVNTILSWPGLIPLSRLTYCIYLVHIDIMRIYIQNQQTLFYTTDINLVMFFLGSLVISYLVAFVVSLAFEAPMMGLEKIVFRRDSGTNEKRR